MFTDYFVSGLNLQFRDKEQISDGPITADLWGRGSLIIVIEPLNGLYCPPFNISCARPNGFRSAFILFLVYIILNCIIINSQLM